MPENYRFLRELGLQLIRPQCSIQLGFLSGQGIFRGRNLFEGHVREECPRMSLSHQGGKYPGEKRKGRNNVRVAMQD